jgi:hypothetical protein
MKKTWKQVAPTQTSGYVYVASNEFMPGLVKVGRTGMLVKDRLRALYATGVPGPFRIEGERFFVDCYEGETLMQEALSKFGKQCPNREFFPAESALAISALEDLYKSQHKRVQPVIFELQTDEAYLRFLSNGNLTSAEHTFDVTNELPEAQREALRMQLLSRAMQQGAELVAMSIVGDRGVDPESPIRDPVRGMGIPQYDLTAFEYSILMGLVNFEKYLVRRGCDLRNSNVLFLVIDVMINGPRTFDIMAKCTNFAVGLVNRGANVHQPLTAGIFSEARRKPNGYTKYNFDIYPRSSNLSCLEITARLASENAWFAKLQQAMTSRFESFS